MKTAVREGSGLTDSVFLVVDSDVGQLATFAGALTSRYVSEYEIRTAATASEAHAILAALSAAGITVALLIVSRPWGTQNSSRSCSVLVSSFPVPGGF